MLKDVNINYNDKSNIMQLLKGVLKYRYNRNNDVLITLKTISNDDIINMLETLNNDNVKTEAWFHQIDQYQSYRNNKK